MEGPKKDGRAIKDKTWQAEKSQELIEFLITANYNHHISPKIIQSPTRKDFECIFQVQLMGVHESRQHAMVLASASWSPLLTRAMADA